MIPRIAESEIKKGLSRQAAVALIGPRQVGKTTLAFEIAHKHNGFYLDLESIDDRHRLAQPVLSHPASAFFYRTTGGAEIDLVIDRGNSNLWAIEIKRNLSGHVERGFHQACLDLNPERAFVVYAGKDSYPVSDKIQAISIYEMAQLIRNF